MRNHRTRPRQFWFLSFGFLAPLIAANLAFAQTPTIQVDYGTDPVDDGTWPNLTANTTTAGLDRILRSGVTYRPISQTIGNISNSNAIAGGSTSNQNNGLFLPNGATNDAYGDTDQFGNAFTLRNTTFEIVFRLSNLTNARRILWETGGGTGTSFTTDANVLQFRHRSNNNVASVTYDLNNLGTLGDGRNPAVADFLMLHGNVDLGSNSIELFVNGQSVGVDGAGGAANDGLANSATNISDWDGGDGDGIGNHGGANLGGFGGGFNFDGGNYTSVAGDIAGFRIYSETGAASQSGAMLDAAAIATRFGELFLDNIFSAQSGNWADGATWSPVNNPEDNNLAIIGGGTHTVTVDSAVGDQIGKVLIGHDLGTNDGNGALTVINGGELNILGDLLINSSAGNDRRGTLNVNDAGVLNIGGNIIYGAGGDEGGTINIRGSSNGPGILNVTNIIERVGGVDSAQLHIDGGILNVSGDTITVQSFRTGNAAGGNGSFTLNAGQTLTNTGTFFAGNSAVGTFANDGGTVRVSNAIRISENPTGAGSELINEAGTIDVLGGQVDIGRRGATESKLAVEGGAVSAGVRGGTLVPTRFGNDGGAGTLEISGGSYLANGDLTTGATGSGKIDLSGGTLELPDVATIREITSYDQSGGTLQFEITNPLAPPPPITVSGTADFAGAGAVIQIDDARPSSSAGDEVTWTGAGIVADPASGVWTDPGTATNWEATVGGAVGAQLAPDSAGSPLVTNTAFTIISAASLTNFQAGVSPTSADPANWALSDPGNGELVATYVGPSSGGAATAVIDDPQGNAISVQRVSDLLIAGGAGNVSAAGLRVAGGELQLTDGSTLQVGGDAAATVVNSGGTIDITGNLQLGSDTGTPTVNLDGGVTSISGDLIFGSDIAGAQTAQGGIINVNAGSVLNVAGNVNELAPAVNNAQLHLNGGTFDITGTSTTQRFSLGEAAGARLEYRMQNDITTTGTTAIGHGDGSGADLIIDGENLTLTAANLSVGQGVSNTASVSAFLVLDAGTINITNGAFNVAGDNQNKVDISGELDLGRGGSPATVNVAGGNTEFGHGGMASVVLGPMATWNQNTNNIVIGQGASANADVRNEGAQITLHPAGDLNFNRGVGVYEQLGGTIEMRDLNLGNNVGTSRSDFVLERGLVIINRDIDYRNGGVADSIRIDDGGELRFTGAVGPAAIHIGNRTPDPGGTHEFRWRGGRIQGLETFNGDLEQGGGTLAPGTSPGTTTVTGDYTISGFSMVEIELDWDGIGIPVAGTHYDQIVVGGQFAAGNAHLELIIVNPSIANAPIGSRFVIVDGSTAPQGEFAQGSTIKINGLTFTIEYGGISGDDVELVLTAVASNFGGDDDDDSIINLLEMAFGTDPADPADGAQGLPAIVVAGNQATIRYRQLEAGGFTYRVEESTDLAIWTPVASALAGDQTGAPPGIDFYEANVTIGAGERKFLRVFVAPD